MSDRPLHEVVAERSEFFACGGVVNHRDKLAAVLKAADAMRHANRADTPHRYDAAVADLRRALEGE